MKTLRITILVAAIALFAGAASAQMMGMTMTAECDIPAVAAGNLFADPALGYPGTVPNVVSTSSWDFGLNYTAEWAGIKVDVTDTHINITWIDQTPGAWNPTGSLTFSGFAEQVGIVSNVAFGPGSNYYQGTHALTWTDDSITFHFDNWMVADYAFVTNYISLAPAFGPVAVEGSTWGGIKSMFR